MAIYVEDLDAAAEVGGLAGDRKTGLQGTGRQGERSQRALRKKLGAPMRETFHHHDELLARTPKTAKKKSEHVRIRISNLYRLVIYGIMIFVESTLFPDAD